MVPPTRPPGELIRPVDYREWTYVTSGVGMTYGPAQPATGQPAFFDNVFVNRESYRAFTKTGRWPDKTMFLLEIRRGELNVSINNGGQTQGEVVALESAVKDAARFPDGGWGYFTFGRGRFARVRRSAARTPRQLLQLPREQHGRGEHVRAVLSDLVRGGEEDGDGEGELRSAEESEPAAGTRVGIDVGAG